MNKNICTSHTSASRNRHKQCRITLNDFSELSFDVLVGKALDLKTANSPQAGLATQSGEPPAASESLARVLIADDTPSVRESLAKLLRSEGYEVEVAANGREALEKFDSGRIDLVLLDLDMPVTNGWDAFEQVLARKPQQAVIIITGQPEPRQWTSVMRPGIMIAKPINAPLLLDAIRQALAEPNSSREERITMQRTLARHTRPLAEHLRWNCYPRGGLNE